MICLIREIALEQKLTAYKDFELKSAEASISGYTIAGCYKCNGKNLSCESYVPRQKRDAV